MNKLLTLRLTGCLLIVVQTVLGGTRDGIPVTNVNHNVIIYDTYFSPDTVTANIGDTITWMASQQNDYSNNTVATQVPPGAYPWSSPLMGPGDSYSYLIGVAGTYFYEANNHNTFAASFTLPGGSFPGINVIISDSSFAPDTFSAVVGDTVTWIAPYGNVYTDNSFSDSIPSAAAAWNSSPLYPGQDYWYVITQPGVYTYQSNSHRTFAGSFTVTGYPAGIAEVAGPTDGLIFQNPFCDQLRIYGGQQGLVTLYDISGRKIADALIAGSAQPIEINTGGLSDGVYFISFSDNGKLLQTYKAVKEN